MPTPNQNSSLERLFREHYAELVRASERISRDRGLAEDVVQNVFVRFFDRGGLERVENPGAYLRRTVVTRTLNAIRDRRRQQHPGEDALTSAIEQSAAVPDDNLEDLKERLRLAIDELPERARTILTLYRFEGYSYKEIANELEIAPKTVENQLARALKLLRAKLPTLFLASYLINVWPV